MARMTELLDALLPMELTSRHNGFTVRMEEVRSDGSLTYRMEIPGIDPARDIDVCVDDGVVTVSGERSESSQTPERSEFSYGRFVRMISIPRGVDEDSIRAGYHEGILEITMDLPRRASAARHVTVAAGRPASSSAA